MSSFPLNGATDATDKGVLERLVADGNPGAATFHALLEDKYGIGIIPDRMKELEILISNNYQIAIDSSGLYVFRPH
jgi:hypothetical protein